MIDRLFFLVGWLVYVYTAFLTAGHIYNAFKEGIGPLDYINYMDPSLFFMWILPMLIFFFLDYVILGRTPALPWRRNSETT